MLQLQLPLVPGPPLLLLLLLLLRAACHLCHRWMKNHERWAGFVDRLVSLLEPDTSLSTAGSLIVGYGRHLQHDA
jgi:hypothetical protein